MKFLRVWVDCFGTLVIPDDLKFRARNDGLLDRRCHKQNAAFKAWLDAELRRLRGGA